MSSTFNKPISHESRSDRCNIGFSRWRHKWRTCISPARSLGTSAHRRVEDHKILFCIAREDEALVYERKLITNRHLDHDSWRPLVRSGCRERLLMPSISSSLRPSPTRIESCFVYRNIPVRNLAVCFCFSCYVSRHGWLWDDKSRKQRVQDLLERNWWRVDFLYLTREVFLSG